MSKKTLATSPWWAALPEPRLTTLQWRAFDQGFELRQTSSGAWWLDPLDGSPPPLPAFPSLHHIADALRFEWKTRS